jgi:TolA-binding protein
MKIWRTAAILFFALSCLFAALGFFIYENRKDLSFLYAKETILAPAPQKRKNPVLDIQSLPGPSVEPPEQVPQKSPVSIENIRFLPYEGESRTFLPVINSISGLESSLPAAIKILGGKNSALPTKEDAIDFVPVDWTRISSEDAPYQVVIQGNENPVRILLPVEPVSLKYYPLEELTAAALVEALLTKRSRGFADSPEFLKHGISLYISGFGDYYEKRFILKNDREPERMILPLNDNSAFGWANGFWAVKSLRDKKGEEGVTSLLEKLSSGMDYKTAIESTFGSDFNSFQDYYKNYSLTYIASLTENRQTFRKALLLLRELKEEESRALLLDFTKNHPTDIYSGEASYYLNYSYYRLGDYKKANDGFLDLLNNRPFSTASQGKAHYFLGRSYELKGFKTLAVIEYRLSCLEENDLLRKAAEMRLKELDR